MSGRLRAGPPSHPLMPQVTPNRTNHLRHDVAFRGTRADPFATPAAIEKRNRRRKSMLIHEARALANAPDLIAAGRGLVRVKREWTQVGSAGAEHDANLEGRLKGTYDDFRARYEREGAQATVARAGATVAGDAAPEDVRNPTTTKPYAPLGTGLSGDEETRRAAGDGDGKAQEEPSNGASVPRYAELATGRSGDSEPEAKAADGTEPSQARRTVASQPGNTVGGGAAGKTGARSDLAHPAAKATPREQRGTP